MHPTRPRRPSRAAAALILCATVLLGPAVDRSQPAAAVVPGDAAGITVTGGPIGALTTSPAALTPAFAPGTLDYTIPCQAGVNTVTVTIGAQSGSIAAGGFQGASVTVGVQLLEGQPLIVEAPDPITPTTTTQYWIRCLPHDFPTVTVNRPGNPSPGWYVTSTLFPGAGGHGLYAMIMDGNGTPVWYMPTGGAALDFRVLKDHTVSWGFLTGPGVGATDSSWTLYDLDTQRSSTLDPPIQPLDAHELLPLANGNYMSIASPVIPNVPNMPPGVAAANGNLIDCVIEEFDPSGALVWSWSAYDHVDVTETTLGATAVPTVDGRQAADLYHCNSVDVDPAAASPSSADVLVSMRNTSAVYRINRADAGVPNGKILWRIGGAGANKDGAQILAIAGDAQTTISGQHDARFRPNGAISIYDNHTGLPGPARGVSYVVDTTAGTATLDFEYEAPDGKASNATGNFQRLDNGADNVIGWGFHGVPSMSEVDGSGQELLELSFPAGVNLYRISKVPYGALDHQLLRATAGANRAGPTPPTGWQPPGELTTAGSLAGAATITGPVRPVSAGPGRVEAFWKGADGDLWHVWSWDGGLTWTGPGTLGSGPLGGDPHPVSSAPGRLDVFWRGTDNALWHDWYFDGQGWHGPVVLSGAGAMASDPYPVSFTETGIDVFWKGADGDLWHTWYLDGHGWQPPSSLGGGPLASDPQPIVSQDYVVDVFWKGQDGNLWHHWYVEGWHGAAPLASGPLLSDPAPVSPSPGEITVFWRGPGDGLWENTYRPGVGWIGANGLGASGMVRSTPAPVSAAYGKIDVFWRGADGTAQQLRAAGDGQWILAPQSSPAALRSTPRPVDAGLGRIVLTSESLDGNVWFQSSAYLYSLARWWICPVVCVEAGGAAHGDDATAIGN